VSRLVSVNNGSHKGRKAISQVKEQVMRDLKSDLGKEYSKAYSRSSLIQIMNWANKAEETLNNKSNEQDPDAKKWTVLDDDAEFYADFAQMIQAILDAQ
jgi:hypothetical protein